MRASHSNELHRAILAEARALVDREASVAEYCSRVFGPDGLLRQMWSTDAERHELVRSPLFKQLQDMLHDLGSREAAAFERDITEAVEPVTVTLPRSLHTALRDEAAARGISLSELIREKLRGGRQPIAGASAGGKRERRVA